MSSIGSVFRLLVFLSVLSLCTGFLVQTVLGLSLPSNAPSGRFYSADSMVTTVQIGVILSAIAMLFYFGLRKELLRDFPGIQLLVLGISLSFPLTTIVFTFMLRTSNGLEYDNLRMAIDAASIITIASIPLGLVALILSVVFEEK